MTTVITPIPLPSATADAYPWSEGGTALGFVPSVCPQTYQDLPLNRLSSYEPVTDQFMDYGLTVQGAIALRPSNPSFVDIVPAIGLMPLGQALAMRLTLVQPRAKLRLQLRGYQDVSLHAITAEGHRLTSAIIQRSRQQENNQAPQEIITLQAENVRQVVIASSGIFLLTGLQLFS